MSGEPKREEKQAPDTHESLASEVIALSNRFVDTMLAARSEEGARAAVGKLDGLAAEYEALARRMEEIGLPDEAMRGKIEKMIKDNERFVAAKMDSFVRVMLGNKKIGQTLQSGIEEFSQRIDGLSVFEQWSGADRVGGGQDASETPAPGAADTGE